MMEAELVYTWLLFAVAVWGAWYVLMALITDLMDRK